jgi:molybdopterin synthase sulfur carrier subunit
MVKVEITFYGALTKLTKNKNIEMNVSALKEALNTLALKYGDQFKDRIYDEKGKALNTLALKYGDQFKDRIYDEKGKLRRFINIYVNGKDIRYLNHINTQFKNGDTVSIIPAVGGG